MVGAAYLVGADPHDPNIPMPRCPIKATTGLDCPSCGGLRCVHELLNRQFLRALHDNAYLVVVTPVLLWLGIRRVRAAVTGNTVEVPRGAAYALLVTALVWAVVRNTPVWRWKPGGPTDPRPAARPGSRRRGR